MIIDSNKTHDIGYLYAFISGGLGTLIMLVIGLLVNNLSARRQYPEFWY
ncbi:HPP family protein [Desulfocapsa sulfexigens]|nr:HPP family protein [Desulfocapsa sulfexigens]